ncbi:MAG: alpha-L-fucosidase [Bacteroides acidifaciens]|uniref:alpha-L-fucosidase n=1 Tax=Bacteroides acidifaciens TaxID=85831 RepID=UPI0023D4B57B|nr:alpha-L-fucosidase [Bacteroides acidifaciens]MDE6822551.1 alpha-L-fucosidase [Bacteroides acidifaciens]MDE6986141.1 alpha-L-fucosidase [Bacteroides acidifaciens]
MKRFLSIVLILTLTISAFAQPRQGKMEHNEKMGWWREAKFGMFIHWGPYCLYGGVYNGFNQRRGGAEWIMNRCKIPVREYRAKASTFNPTRFDAEDMVLTAKNAGMKYIIFTTKHHDGFAMFKSNASNFNIVDYTPFKRDIVDELAKACRKHGIKLGFYYSQTQDWCNPGGGTIRKEMKEGWANPDSVAIDQYTKANLGGWDCLQRSASIEDYFKNVAIPQIKELLTNYGDVAVMWWDTPHRISKEIAQEIMDELAKYPQVIINDRLKRPDFPGDYKTPEGRIPKAKDIERVDWETCMNIGTSWGYKSWENKWKNAETVIRNLNTIAARGGNYLLNVGPDPTGTIPAPAMDCLKQVGEWMKVNGEAIYATQRSEVFPAWGECIRKDEKKNSVYYLSVFKWPKDGKLTFETPHKVKKATLLADKSTLKFSKTNNGIVIDVPAKAPDKIATVIKLELSGKLAPVELISNTAKAFEIVDE